MPDNYTKHPESELRRLLNRAPVPVPDVIHEVLELRTNQTRIVATINGMAKLLGGEAPDLPRLVDLIIAERDVLRAKEAAYAEALAKACCADDCASNKCVCGNPPVEHGIGRNIWSCRLNADPAAVYAPAKCDCWKSTLSEPIARGKELLDLRARLGTAERDTKRIDWLEQNPEAHEPRIVYHPPDGLITWRCDCEEFYTLREAIDGAMEHMNIDAAMKQSPPVERQWRCNCPELGPSQSTTDRERCAVTARLYATALEFSDNNGVTWTDTPVDKEPKDA